MKTKYNIAIAIATLAVLAALCTTASAGDYGSGCQYTNFYNGTLENGGDIYFDVKGHYDSAGATQSYTFENVPDGRQVVRMYPGIWLGSPSPGRVTEWSLEINGHTDYFNFTEPDSIPFCNMDCPPEDGTGEHCTVSCSGCGVCSVTYNAGPYVATGDNDVTYWTSEQIYSVGLLAVYEDASMEELQYWIKEGHEYPDDEPYHVYFNESSSSGPIDIGNISTVEYYTYGYPHCPGESGWPNLNGDYIGSPNITISNNYAPVFYGWTEIPPAYIAAPDNCFLYPTLGNDRMMIPVLGIHYSAESTDLQPPYTEGHDPAPGATDVPSNTDIVVHVKDDGTGVDQSTIAMTVEGASVAPIITGTAVDYTVTYTPGSRFECGQVVNVSIDASDLASPSNVMSTDSYSFTIMSAATPFLISGWVNDSDSDPVDDPDVTVTNTNTSEIYEVENITTSNYYQVSTSSETVSAGNVLHFVAVKETTTEFNYTVTVADMNRGGFVQNITIDKTPRPDLVVTQVNAYHYDTSADAWFNLTNEIDVTVENTGDINATETFNVSLSIEGVPFGKLSVSQLNVSESKTVTFEGWTPIGEDCLKPVCQFEWSSKDYNLTAVADSDNDVEERYETNNETTVADMACYNGYMGDEPLEGVAHGVLHGGVLFTTGDGRYGGLYSAGSYRDTQYDIELPAGASVELAHLNVYYTWNNPLGTCPEMEVNITTPGGTTYTALPLLKTYDDIKCACVGSSWVLPWGNYVYDLTDYITENGTYTVRVKNVCTACSYFCPAAPGIVLVYEDANASPIEYWINEGADKLIGGRRVDGGSLAWWECINNATFQASGETGNVVNATLGVVSPWGDSVTDDILFFNGVEVGRGVYAGYSSLYEKTIGSISMYVGASGDAQVGANLTDVTALYLQGSENMAGQADDGDCMMPANAFLVVEYEEEVETYTISGYTSPAADKVNITNLNKSEVVVDRPADYIDPVTGFYNLTLNVPGEVVTGNVLQIIACDVPDNYTSNCNVSDHTVVNAPGEDYNVNLTLNHYCQNYYPSFPYRTWEQSSWSGPAVMQMLVDHYRPEEPTQSYLNATGIAHNQDCNADLPYVDPAGTKWILNEILHNTSSYGGGRYANYGIGNYASIEDVLHYICKYQYLGPGSAPAYGDYTNWMVVRGIHTDVKPTYVQDSYTIYGFWINDPYNETLEGPGGIGENTYKTVDQWSSTYHLSLTGVDVNDTYYNKYVAVCEPPEDDDVAVTLATPKPRLADAITPVLMTKPMKVYGIEQLALERTVTDDEMLKIVKAAIDGVTEELIPYDSEFAEIFAKTTAGAPKLVASDIGDYYVVPFNVPVIVRPPVKKMPIEIERLDASGDNKFERVKSLAANAVIEPIPIEPIKVEKTLVVVIVDAEDGSFKEASWVTDPVKYLPVSKREALKLALSEVQITSASELSNLSSKPIVELVYRDASPYYPDWKVTVDGTVFYVAQDGTVSS